MFSKKTTKISLSIWRYVVSVKLMVKILSIFVAFLENMNFTSIFFIFYLYGQQWGYSEKSYTMKQTYMYVHIRYQGTASNNEIAKKVIKLVKFSAIFHYALTVLWPSMHFSQNVQNTEQNANAYQ
jgi:hypothetical protein